MCKVPFDTGYIQIHRMCVYYLTNKRVLCRDNELMRTLQYLLIEYDVSVIVFMLYSRYE